MTYLPFFLSAPFELRVDHAQIAVGDLDALDARGQVANADADGKPRRYEIGGEDQQGEDREAFAQNADDPGMTVGAFKGAPALFGRADRVPPAAGNDIRFNRHLPAQSPSTGVPSAGPASRRTLMTLRPQVCLAQGAFSAANGRRDRSRTSPSGRARPGPAKTQNRRGRAPRAPRASSMASSFSRSACRCNTSLAA